MTSGVANTPSSPLHARRDAGREANLAKSSAMDGLKT